MLSTIPELKAERARLTDRYGDYDEVPRHVERQVRRINEVLESLGVCTCSSLTISFIRTDENGKRTTYRPAPIGYELVPACPDHAHPAETCPHVHA